MVVMLMSMSVTFSQEVAVEPVSSVKDALALALKHEQIASKVDEMKLYMSSSTISVKRQSWSFTFYDGGSLLHTVSLNSEGKTYYSSRDKGSSKLFTQLDFTKLPAPNDVLIDGVVKQAKEALSLLKFEPNDAKLYINYNVRNNYKQKDVAIHTWNVSMPVGEGASGKMVGFENGKLSTVMNSMIKK